MVKDKELEYDERLMQDKMNKRSYSLTELTTLEEMAASEDASVSYGESWTVQENLEFGLYVKRVGDTLYQIVKVHAIVRPSKKMAVDKTKRDVIILGKGFDGNK